jgi:peroxiredoxin
MEAVMLAPIRENYWFRETQPRPVSGRRMRVSEFVSAFVMLALLAIGIGSQAHAETGQDYASQAGAQLIGRQIPPLVLTTIDGKTVDLGALRGKKAGYLKVWATWCSPCREQMPHFEHVQQNARDDLQVVAIDIGFDDTLEQIKAVQREFGLTMPLVRDDDGKLGETFGLRVTPQHIIVDKDGRIAYVGHLADAKLESALADARGGKPASKAAHETPSANHTDIAKLTIKTIDGQNVPLVDPTHARGTTLVFFSPWCEGYFAKTRPQSSAQCRAMRERLATADDGGKQRWVAVAFEVWTSEDDVRKFRDKNHVAVPLALDVDGAIFRRFGVHNVPVVVELDANGNVLSTTTG